MAMRHWAVACALASGSAAHAGLFDAPKPEVFARAEDRQRARLLDAPCTQADVGHGCYRLDNLIVREPPCAREIDARVMAFLPTPRCYRMDKPRRYKGVWIDEFEGQAFVPDGASAPVWPRSEPSSPGWRKEFDRARAARIWIDVGKLPHRFRIGGRKVRIDFIGRKTLHSGAYGHFGLSGHEIIVDRVIAMQELN
jgi:hypothetical protein